jgi:predicted dehydrogenase
VAGAGALGDLGSHILSLMRYLAGEISEVCGEARIVIKERPVARGAAERRAVDNDDITTALLRFANGATGSLEASRVAIGRKMLLAFEISGSRGALRFNQERFNELELAVVGRPGVATLVAGPEYAPYGEFCPAGGHQLGFNDLKVIEIAALIDGIANDKPLYPDFAEAARIAHIVDAILASHGEGRWMRVEGSARPARAAQ